MLTRSGGYRGYASEREESGSNHGNENRSRIRWLESIEWVWWRKEKLKTWWSLRRHCYLYLTFCCCCCCCCVVAFWGSWLLWAGWYPLVTQSNSQPIATNRFWAIHNSQIFNLSHFFFQVSQALQKGRHIASRSSWNTNNTIKYPDQGMWKFSKEMWHAKRYKTMNGK